MNYKISNNHLTVEISERGAELQSIKGSDGTEYLWQGDPKYWSDRALTIFPYVARLTEGKYTFKDTTYEMPIHGFAPASNFMVDSQDADRIVMSIESNEETKKMYPFDFIFRVDFSLDGNRLIVKYIVDNKGSSAMYFGLGGHPGFNVPMDEGLEFSDYRLDFIDAKNPTFIVFTDDCFVTDERREFPLEEKRYYRLHHDMFDNDAIVLTDTSHKVKLSSDKGSHSVEMHFPDQDVFGFWHWPKTDAPYICLEPWSSLPSRKDIIEDLENQPDLIRLEGNSTYTTAFDITFK